MAGFASATGLSAFSVSSTRASERRRLLEDLEREREERRQERARADRLEDELQKARRPWWRKMFGD